MKATLLNEIIDCLPTGRTHFRYFKGAYASRLLSMVIAEQVRLAEIKQSRFASLLNHQTLKPVIANCGAGIISKQVVDMVWQEPSLPFLLSLAKWGGVGQRGWYQKSRFGENLVLQLNMPNEHMQRWHQQVDENSIGALNRPYSQHPVQSAHNNAHFRDTLAWSRVDIDFEHNEALIEEVQSDGVRYLRGLAKRKRHCACSKCKKVRDYLNWFNHYSKIWSEAMLMATIWFIRKELGLKRIYMHTARSGWQVKQMENAWLPPRSLYSDLPKKFAFKQTWAAPELLLQTRSYQKLIRKQPDIDFYQLNLHEIDQTGGVVCPTQ